MKLLFLVIGLFTFFPIDIYEISFPDINGRTINMSEFKGKRILVYSFDAIEGVTKEFSFLDSLQHQYEDLQVIAVPGLDARRNKRVEEILSTQIQVKSRLIIAYTGDLQKSGEINQHPLFQWLTNKELNHFVDNDGQPGQYYIISAKGTLHAFLQPGVSHAFVESILRTTFDERNHYILNPETNKYEPQF